MRRWLMWSATIFVIGFAWIAFNNWQSGNLPEPRNIVIAFVFWLTASLLIPGRFMIRKLRREKAQRDKQTIETFK